MLFEKIESPGLAHNSYLLGDSGEAVVIDPRRDCDIYARTAFGKGYCINHIIETHRNEDYVSGSTALAASTMAEVWHADSQLAYRYGHEIEDGKTWKIGRFTLEALHTPGHTPGSMSYVLREPSGEPAAVFTGDTLLTGSVGRTDLFGTNRATDLALSLYDSIHRKLLPLGDGVVLCPAHGPGSPCGRDISDRPFSTLGLEKKLNPMLGLDKEQFVKKTAVDLERPPYFKRMEQVNLAGKSPACEMQRMLPMNPESFAAAAEARNAVILDARSELAFAAAHIPGALSIEKDILPLYAGWFLSYDDPVLLVCPDNNTETVVEYMVRIGFDGYDALAGYLSGGMLSWHKSAMKSSSTEFIKVHDLCSRLDSREKLVVLDVRNAEEIERERRITGAVNIPLTRIPERKNEIRQDEPVFIFCGSGVRSMTAASILQNKGWENITVVLGGLAAWNSVSCPLTRTL